jgi:hypothetical protein
LDWESRRKFLGVNPGAFAAAHGQPDCRISEYDLQSRRALRPKPHWLFGRQGTTFHSAIWIAGISPIVAAGSYGALIREKAGQAFQNETTDFRMQADSLDASISAKPIEGSLLQRMRKTVDIHRRLEL